MSSGTAKCSTPWNRCPDFKHINVKATSGFSWNSTNSKVILDNYGKALFIELTIGYEYMIVIY